MVSPERRALQLIERICQAGLEPDAWWAVTEALSEDLGGAAVGMMLDFPHLEGPAVYKFGMLPELSGRFADLLARGELPWESGHLTHWVGRFGRSSEVFPDASIPETAFYREWMEPQGFPPVAPLMHTIAVDNGHWAAALGVYRTADSRDFTSDDIAVCNLLVPHLAHAFHASQKLLGVQRQRIALAEVVDRLPTGVILIDAQARALVTNRSADEIIALHDGLVVDEKGIRAEDPHEDATLQHLIRIALEPSRGEGPQAGGVMALSRPSGLRAFSVFVTRLLDVPFEPAAPSGAEAAVLIANPASNPITTLTMLQSLYGLTGAEAELVQLLARGCTLEEAAQIRGVTVNTTRSQLKQVFAKTDTRRQGELVRLILTGIVSMSEK